MPRDLFEENGISVAEMRTPSAQQPRDLFEEAGIKAEALPSRSLFGDVVTAPIRGIANAAETVGRATRAFDPEGGYEIARNIGTGIVNTTERVREYLPSIFKQSQEQQQGGFRAAIPSGIESATQSVLTGLPGGAAGFGAGLATGGVGSIPGAIAGYATSGATLYGAAEYDKFMEEARDAINARKDLSDVEKTALINKTKPYALKSGLVEGGFEFGSDLLEGLTMKIGRPFTQLAKGTIKDLLTTTPKRVLLNMAKVGIVETPTEMSQAYLETGLRQKAGIPTGETPGQAAAGVVLPTLVSSVIFGGVGSIANYRQQKKIEQALLKPDADIEIRKQAAQVTAGGLSNSIKNPVTAQLWLNKAVEDINAGKPVDINTTLEDIVKQYEPPTKAEEEAIAMPRKAALPNIQKDFMPATENISNQLITEPKLLPNIQKEPTPIHTPKIPPGMLIKKLQYEYETGKSSVTSSFAEAFKRGTGRSIEEYINLKEYPKPQFKTLDIHPEELNIAEQYGDAVLSKAINEYPDLARKYAFDIKSKAILGKLKEIQASRRPKEEPVTQTKTRVLPEEQAATTALQPEASPAMAAAPPVTTPTIKESLKVEPQVISGLKEPGSKPAKWLETTGTIKAVLNKEERELLREAEATTPEILNEVRAELSKPNIVQKIKEFASQINSGQSLKDHFPGEEYNTLTKSAPGFFSESAKYSFDEVADKLGITGDELKSELMDFKKRKDKLDSAKQMMEDYKSSQEVSPLVTVADLGLKVGTEFKIQGEKYKVISRDENGDFVIKDGIEYVVDEFDKIPQPDEGSIKQAAIKKGKIKQAQFEYDKAKVDVKPKMESSLTVPALQKGQKGFFDKAGITPTGEKQKRKATLVEQLKTAQPDRPAADIEMTIDLAIKPLAKALGMSPEAVADTYIQEIKKSTTKELKTKTLKQFQDKRGAIEFLPNGKAIIHILENADESTFIHEMFHLYTNIMERVPGLKPQLDILENWIGKPVDKWTVADREKIARGGEKYLWEGNAPTSALKSVFEKFKTWLREIYKAATSLDVKLSDDVRKMWDTWFAGEDITASEETLRGRESGILFQSDAHKENIVEKVVNSVKNFNKEKEQFDQLKELGIIEESITDDFKSKVRQFIQFPLTVAKKYLKFDMIYRRAEQYFRDFENYAKTLGEEVKPYIEGDNQKVINDLLIDARLNKDAAYTNEELKALGHSDEIIKEYRAVTKTLSNALKHMASMLARTNNNIEKIYTYISNIKSGDIKLYTELEDKTNINKSLSKTNWDKPFTSEELKGQVLSSEEIQAYNSVSDMMDKDSNYVPFSRYGDWFVAVRDPNGELIHYPFYEKQKQARAEAVQQANKYAGKEGYKIIIGDVRRLASEAVEGVPVNMQPLIQMLDDEFAKKDDEFAKKSDEDVAVKPKKNLDITASAAYAEILKRGFAGHFIESKNIAGFEQNLSKSISDYILGISRWMASKEARFDFEGLLNGKKDENGKQVGGIDPYEQSQLYGYSKRYIKYILGNSREGSNVRLFMFRYYLGGLVRPALLNFTQPLTTTLPTSDKYIQGGLIRRSKLLMDAFKTAAIPLETLKRSNPNLAVALEQAIKDGKISEQMVKMLRGEVYGKKLYKFDKALSFMFEFSEQANRKSAFIMMYQEAVTNGVKAEGKLQKLSHREAIEFAEAFVTETQFEYSKLNRPEMARGWKAPLFTFRMFSGSYLSLLKSFVKEGEFKALAEALGIMVLLGGAAAFPGLKELEKALEIAGYDPKLYIKKLAGKWGDLFLHGVLYPLGIDVSGALSPPALIPGELQQGVVPAVGGLVLGVLADIPKRIERAWDIFTKQGDVYRTIETLMPEAPRNMMASVRWWKEGEVKTAAYEPIAKVSSFDMALKFFGIQPAVLSKAYEKKHSELILNANNASAGYNWRIAKAFYDHDSTKAVSIIKDIQQHNQSIIKQIQETKDYTLAKGLIIVTQTGIAGQLLKMKRPEITREKSMPKQFRAAYQEIQQVY